MKWTKESPHGAQGVSFEGTGRGRRREDFKLIGLLGNGTFGSVALAKKIPTGDPSLSEEVFALKFVPNDRVSKIEKEVLLRAVGHPFLVQLLAYFQTKGLLCYVMEYVEGGSLRFHLCRHTRFSEDLSRFFAAELILAMNFLHKCRIVHRDIKPDNILLEKNGHCPTSGCAKLECLQGGRHLVCVGLGNIWPQRFVGATGMDLKWTGGPLDV